MSQRVPEQREAPRLWTYSLLYAFPFPGGRGDGFEPNGLVTDETDALYSTTVYGGHHPQGCVNLMVPSGCGTVFKQTPSGSSGYTESIIYRFCTKSHSFGGLPTVADAIHAIRQARRIPKTATRPRRFALCT